MSEALWPRHYLGRWCAGPAVVDGHNIVCSLGEGHDGECAATLREVNMHRRGGQSACIRANCGTVTRTEEPAPP